ncbi:MAG: hypothetical protein AAF928_03900 [Myxococcota bacterium]
MTTPTWTIVFDGPACAGKTSNLRRLYEDHSNGSEAGLVSPEERDGETTMFDWLRLDEFELANGTTCSLLLLGTPGHGAYRSTRHFLLELADAVVFVVESTANRLRWAIPALHEAMVSRPDADAVVLQANKQDLAEALPPGVVVERLGVRLVTVGASSGSGHGVEATLREAVSAAQRVGARSRAPGSLVLPRDPEELMARVLEHLERVEVRTKTLVPGESERPPRDQAGMPKSGAHPSNPVITPVYPPDDGSEPPPSSVDLGATRPRTQSGAQPTFREIPTGSEPTPHIWPAREVRAWLQGLARPTQFQRLKGGDIEGVVGDARYRTHERWCFRDRAEARSAIRARAAAAMRLGRVAPVGGALVLVEEADEGYRLWSVVPRSAPRLDEQLAEMKEAADGDGIDRVLGMLARFLADCFSRAGDATPIADASTTHFSMHPRDVLVCLATQLREEIEPADAVDELRRAAAAIDGEFDASLQERWVTALATTFVEASPDLGERLAIDPGEVSSPAAVRAWLKASPGSAVASEAG